MRSRPRSEKYDLVEIVAVRLIRLPHFTFRAKFVQAE